MSSIEPTPYFIQPYEINRISRNKLHKYILRKKSLDKIYNEISTKPASAYQATTNEQSTLFLAIATNQENIIKTLLELYESDLKLLKESGFVEGSPVLMACGSEEISFVDEKCQQLPTTDDSDKMFILCKSTNSAFVKIINTYSREHQNIVLEIISKLHNHVTFDINLKSYVGLTAVHVASHQGLIWVLEKLFELGAKHDFVDTQNRSPFDFAVENHQLETVKWYQSKFSIDLYATAINSPALFSIAQFGNFEMFQYFMNDIKKHHVDEEIKEIFKRRAEHVGHNLIGAAITSGRADFALKCLQNYDFDVSHCSSFGENILHLATRTWPKNPELCKFIINTKPELLLMEDENGWTPLHLLAMHGWYDEIVEVYQKYPLYKKSFFIHLETDSSPISTFGHRALNDSVNDGHFKLAAFLIENHPNEMESSQYIARLINLALLRDDSSDLIKKLRSLKSFDPNIPDDQGNFAVMEALRYELFDAFYELIEPNDIKNLKLIKDQSGNNLLYHAIWKRPISMPCYRCGTCCMPKDVDSEDEDTDPRLWSKMTWAKYPELPDELTEDVIDKKVKLFSIFKDLIQRDVDVFEKGQNGINLLHDAVDKDNVEVVEELVKMGVPTDTVDCTGNLALHHIKSIDVFKALMVNDDSKILVNQKNQNGKSPFLSYVCLFGPGETSTELLNEFTKHGADVNSSDADGNYPIHYATTESWIEFLISHGADVNVKNNRGENPVHSALCRQDLKTAKYLLHNTNINRFAATNDDASYLGYIALCNVDYQEVFDGELEAVFDELVDKFVNGNSMYVQKLPAAALCYSGNIPLKLVQHPKADLSFVDVDGSTCLHRAITFDDERSLKLVQVLVAKGLDINAAKENGQTPLILAIDYHCQAVTNFLLSQVGINLNSVTNSGDTALHYAARSNNIKILCTLLSMGADYKILNNDNQSFNDVLDEAAKRFFISYQK